MNAAWDGKGFPPVGTVCEIKDEHRDWHECTIKLYDGDDVVWRMKLDEHLIGADKAKCTFRPIRDPKQVAAEAREKAVSGMWTVLNARLPERFRRFDGEALRSALGILHDQGYSKAPGYGELLAFAKLCRKRWGDNASVTRDSLDKALAAARGEA